MKSNLTNGIKLYACSMGKVFRVTHICDTSEEANEEMRKNKDTALIAEDNAGRCYLARQYGALAPSAIMNDAKHDALYGKG